MCIYLLWVGRWALDIGEPYVSCTSLWYALWGHHDQHLRLQWQGDHRCPDVLLPSHGNSAVCPPQKHTGSF